ncbi:MAG TPA: nuclear transport factor 2 family protein [Gemmatimonadales bacterium]|nr:nuclear transport factor 2 family protein [Gemmatimonadales bacterium]
MRTTLMALIILSQSATAQTTRDSLLALDSAWARSYATADTALANKLFDDSLIVTSGNGRLKNKNGEMADVGPLPPGFQIHYFRTSDVRVQPRGGVVTGLAEWSWTMNAQTSTTRRRYTAVYARGGPLGWRMVALHIGPAPEGR